MKQVFFFLTGMVLCFKLSAQVVITNNRTYIKLTDAIADYKKNHKNSANSGEEKNRKGKTFDLARVINGEQEYPNG
jgi:hypothetical protein